MSLHDIRTSHDEHPDVRGWRGITLTALCPNEAIARAAVELANWAKSVSELIGQAERHRRHQEHDGETIALEPIKAISLLSEFPAQP